MISKAERDDVKKNICFSNIGFSCRINKDSLIKIPNDVIEKLCLKPGDFLNIHVGKDNEEDYEELCKALEHEGVIIV